MEKKYIEILNNHNSIEISEVPVLDYTSFTSVIDELFAKDFIHCLNYFAVPYKDKFKFICCIADDENHKILILSHEQSISDGVALESLTSKHFQFHVFEREIHENFGVEFLNHPWLKPIRYPFNRFRLSKNISNYPFYNIESEELHQVGVGPVHAGIIEPGYFRFLCNGENVLHLEIQLGFQHRGVEQLFIDKKNILHKNILSENIAGDTTIGHSLCFTNLIESLNNKDISSSLEIERTIALELERIAIHIGDTAALCTDVAYQFGQVVNEALRTIVINTLQLWCGNRFGKGLIRTFGTHYPLSKECINQIKKNIEDVEIRYLTITNKIFSLPSVLARFEGIGIVSSKQASFIGTVGMASRSSGLKRDSRWSHPFSAYKSLPYEPILTDKGDVWARALLRKSEVEKSIGIIKRLIKLLGDSNVIEKPDYNLKLNPSSISISVVEGWRGEICHTALTNEQGEISYYKIKDPSLHNWMALAIAVREQEISDFPVCNKSYNLSYCGNDL